MLGYLGSFSGYFFEKPVTHVFHDFSVDLGAPAIIDGRASSTERITRQSRTKN